MTSYCILFLCEASIYGDGDDGGVNKFNLKMNMKKKHTS